LSILRQLLPDFPLFLLWREINVISLLTINVPYREIRCINYISSHILSYNTVFSDTFRFKEFHFTLRSHFPD